MKTIAMPSDKHTERPSEIFGPIEIVAEGNLVGRDWCVPLLLENS